MNRAWYLYYGRGFGLNEKDTMCMRYGDMQDMIACMAIENGGAEQVIKKRMAFEKVMELT